MTQDTIDKHGDRAFSREGAGDPQLASICKLGQLMTLSPHDLIARINLTTRPMPGPSTWSQPTSNDDDRWLRQQMGATIPGLDTIDKHGDLALGREGAGDPQLVSICELGRLMTLSPKELIARITLTTRLAEPLAQDHASSNLPRGLPTDAAMASFAALMSTLQRSPAPAFKDTHSTLSDAHRPESGPSATSEDGELDHDDEPMPVPSTWRQPASNADDRWFRQQMGAAAIGLVAALVLIVPTVWCLSGWLGAPRKLKDGGSMTVATDVRTTETGAVEFPVRPVDKSVLATQYHTSSVEPRPAGEAGRSAHKPPAPAQVNVAEPGPARDRVLQEATHRIESGDVLGARELLGAPDSQVHGLVAFALAETYDPNMLAAWGTRGVAADVAKAKALYGEALERGVARARRRLEALQ